MFSFFFHCRSNTYSTINLCACARIVCVLVWERDRDRELEKEPFALVEKAKFCRSLESVWALWHWHVARKLCLPKSTGRKVSGWFNYLLWEWWWWAFCNKSAWLINCEKTTSRIIDLLPHWISTRKEHFSKWRIWRKKKRQDKIFPLIPCKIFG